MSHFRDSILLAKDIQSYRPRGTTLGDVCYVSVLVSVYRAPHHFT